MQASAQVRNLPHAEVADAQATLWVTQALPGPTDASVQSSHESVVRRRVDEALDERRVTGDTRTLAPTFVQSGSPNDVTPATRVPAAVSTSAGPPESPSQAPLRSVWS